MVIQTLTIDNFRNIKKALVEPAAQLNIIVGDNGSGKTSFLEAIHFLATARSFRTFKSRQLINLESEQFILFAQIIQNQVLYPVGVARDKVSTKIKISNHFAHSAAELASILPVQIINPDVHKLLEEGPRYRRRFLEWGVFHVKHNYFPVWQKCQHILKQRNAALKNRWPKKDMVEWDNALVNVSKEMARIREEYLNQLLPHVNHLIEQIDGLPVLDFSFNHGWPENTSLQEILRKNFTSDQKRGVTQYGPHRADLRIRVQQNDARDIVSRGQQKIITALLKLAQVRLIESLHLGKTPVLLIDDLPAELDQHFNDALLAQCLSGKAQIFLTATASVLINPELLKKEYKMFHVKHGTIKQINTSS